MNKRMTPLPRLALIAGPTASGKSALALGIAEREGGTIVNADASQLYRELRILTARPSLEEEARVPHRLFGSRPAASPCSAAEWAADAIAEIDAAVACGRLPVVVGGTGLYLRTLLDGIAPVPPIDHAVRAAVRAMPAGEAYAALAREDAAAAAALHPNDTGRSQRALEVVRSTGRSLLDWRGERSGGIADRFAVTHHLVDLPCDVLRSRIDRRVRAMVAAGGVDELAGWLEERPDPALPLMRAIGVPEFAAWLRGDSGLEEAMARAAQATWRYARRQRTWIRHQLSVGCDTL